MCTLIAKFAKLHLSIKTTKKPSSLSHTWLAALLLRITFPTEGHSANANFSKFTCFVEHWNENRISSFHFSKSRITDKELILSFQEFVTGMQAKKFSCQKCSSYCEITISRANKNLNKSMLFFPEDHVKAMLLWKTLCCELITVPGQPAITDTTIFTISELFIGRKRHCAINDLKTLREKKIKKTISYYFSNENVSVCWNISSHFYGDYMEYIIQKSTKISQ